MAAQIYPSSILVEDATQWDNEARRKNVASRPLKSCRNLQSGSKITEEQFLLFRTLFPRTRRNFTPNRFGLNTFYQQANLFLVNPDFQEYLVRITAGGPSQAHFTQWTQNTLFKVPLVQQRQITSTKYGAGSKITQLTESAVNTSLVSFLQALAMLAAPLNSQWNANMIPLEAYFGSPRGQRRAYTAVTDGQLQNLSSKEILAFLECKRGLRLKHSPQVEMQENAQAVAWVKEYPDTTPRPW
ncbi:hypothetical protein Plec18167_000345 [Paecilomyces lecythidis]|uniref:Uncharacterized protein n=1 Tax=Paecilomyces lecythidis TaxID=3004212 RepID=A0ABR3YEH4_9EURO